MVSGRLKRLSLLLPTVAGLSMVPINISNAYQLEASDYAARLAAALSQRNTVAVSLVTGRLRSCGVNSIIVDGGATSLDDIDALAAALASGGSIPEGLLQGDAATFLVGALSQQIVDCVVSTENPPPSLIADNEVNPSST